MAYYHPDREVAQNCDYCERPVCSECIRDHQTTESRRMGTETGSFTVTKKYCAPCHYQSIIDRRITWGTVAFGVILWSIVVAIITWQVMDFAQELLEVGVDISSNLWIIIIFYLIPILYFVIKKIKRKADLPEQQEKAREELLSYFRNLNEIPESHQDQYQALQTEV